MSFRQQIFIFGALYSLAAGLFWYVPAPVLAWALPAYVILGVGIFTLLSYKFAALINTLTMGVQSLKSNLYQEIPLKYLNGEIGDLARVLEEARKQAIEAQESAKEEVKQVEMIPTHNQGQMLPQNLLFNFSQQINEQLSSIQGITESIKYTAKGMSELIVDTSGGMKSVSSVAKESSLNVQTVASAAEQLSASIAEISRQVAHSAEVARNASTAAEETDAHVTGLASAASKINDVVQLIQDIANQTHLLALNATIEAARAGEAGKGFAVVASEVKNLANQTAKATDDISDQIEQIQRATEKTVTSIQSIGGIIHEVNETATAIAAAIEEQTAATHEIARNVQQVWQGAQQVTDKITDVTGKATETDKKSAEMGEAADQLSEQMQNLQKSISSFVHQAASNT